MIQPVLYSTTYYSSTLLTQELDEDAVVQLDPPMLEISDAWSYQDINHVLTQHDTNQHMYRVIPMISSAVTDTDISSVDSKKFRSVWMSRLRSYTPLLR